jgi:hypothetical protein
MFDLLKNIEKYKGIPPYASELYGVYQPLLGWQSSLTKKWVQRGGAMLDPRVKRILDGHIKPGPDQVTVRQNGALEMMLAQPLEPGSGRSPYTVLLVKDLNSELLTLLRTKVQAFVEANGGRLPDGSEWVQIVDINNLMDQENGDLRKVNDIHFKRLQADAIQLVPNGQLTPTLISAAKKAHLELMQYESQIATFLLFHAEAQAGRSSSS